MVAVFQGFGYPYKISLSWPSLLVSIRWLIELLSNDDPYRDLATDLSTLEKAFGAFAETGYALFMNGEDDRLAEWEENLVNSFETVNSSIRVQIAGTSDSNALLSVDSNVPI